MEAALFGGMLMGVAATNALELGIDVGSLDITLHLGFPGSVSSLLQQAGRAGRREQPSASIYVAFDGPTDQFFFRHPQQLFGRPVEKAQIDAQNEQLMGQHLACAALELPLLLDADQAYFGPRLPAIAAELRCSGLLSRHPHMPPCMNALLYTGTRENPAAAFSLRAIDPERYQIVNEAADGAVIEEIEESKAFFEVYDGAVYLYQARRCTVLAGCAGCVLLRTNCCSLHALQLAAGLRHPCECGRPGLVLGDADASIIPQPTISGALSIAYIG